MLYADLWCSVGINELQSEPFQLSRSIRQGCPLAPFLYLFVADCLGYVLEKDENIKGLVLPGNHKITDQEYADDTNLYLHGSAENLDNVKLSLELFASASRAKINWHKSKAIWVSQEPRTFQRETVKNYLGYSRAN